MTNLIWSPPGDPGPEDPRESYERFRAGELWGARLRMVGGALALTLIISVLILYLAQTAAVWLFSGPLRVLMRLAPQGLIDELFTVALYAMAFLLPFLAYAKVVGYPLQTIPRDPPYPPVTAAVTGVGLAISVAGVLAATAVGIFFSLFGLYPMSFPPVSHGPVVGLLYLFNMTVLPALVEEFICRGIILGSLRPFGDRFAIVVSALFFGLMHRNMTQFPNAFLLGLALGYFVVKTNSIWTGIIMHFANNALAVLLAGGVLELFMFPLYLALGAGGLIYLGIVRRVDLSLRPSRCPLREGSLYRRFFLSVPVVMLLLLMAWVFYLNFSH